MKRFAGSRFLSGLLSAAMVVTMAPQTAFTSFAQELPEEELVFEEANEESASFVAEDAATDEVEFVSSDDKEEADTFETAYTATIDYLYKGGIYGDDVENTYAYVFDPATPMYEYNTSKEYGPSSDGYGKSYTDSVNEYGYRVKDDADFEKDFTFTVMPLDDGYQLQSSVENIVAVYYQKVKNEAATANLLQEPYVAETLAAIDNQYVIADASKGDYYAGDVNADGSREITITKKFVEAAKAAHEADGVDELDGVIKVVVLKDAGMPKECEAVFTGDVRADGSKKVTVKTGMDEIDLQDFSKDGMKVSSVEITLNGKTEPVKNPSVGEPYYVFDAMDDSDLDDHATLTFNTPLINAAVAAGGVTVKINGEKKFDISGDKTDYVTYNFALTGTAGLPGDWHKPAEVDYEFTIAPLSAEREVVSVTATIAGQDKPFVLMKDKKITDLDPTLGEDYAVVENAGVYTCTIPFNLVTGDITIATETTEVYDVDYAKSEGVEFSKATDQTLFDDPGTVKTETALSFIVLPKNGYNGVVVDYTQTKADGSKVEHKNLAPAADGYTFTIPAEHVTGPLKITAKADQATTYNTLKVFVGGRAAIAWDTKWNVFDGTIKGTGTPSDDDIKGETESKAIATASISGGDLGTVGYPYYFHVNTGYNNKITEVYYQVDGVTYPKARPGMAPYTRYTPATPVLGKDGKNNGVYMIDRSKMTNDITIWTNQSEIDWIKFYNTANNKVKVTVNGAAVTGASKDIDQGEPMHITVTGASDNVKVTKVRYSFDGGEPIDMGDGGDFTIPVDEMAGHDNISLLVESEEIADPATYVIGFEGDVSNTKYGYTSESEDRSRGIFATVAYETHEGKLATEYKTSAEKAAYAKFTDAQKYDKLRIAVTEDANIAATVFVDTDKNGKFDDGAYTGNIDDDATSWTASKNKAVVEVKKKPEGATHANVANIKGIAADELDEVTFVWKDKHNNTFDDNIMTFTATLDMKVTDLFSITESSGNASSVKKGSYAETEVFVKNIATGREINPLTATTSVTPGKSNLVWTISNDNTQNVRLYTDITTTSDGDLTGVEKTVRVHAENKLVKGDKIKYTATANRFGAEGKVVNSKVFEKELTVVTKTPDDFYVVPTVTITRGGEDYNPSSGKIEKLELAEGGLTSAKVSFDVYEILDPAGFVYGSSTPYVTGDGKADKEKIEHFETFEKIRKVTPASYEYEALTSISEGFKNATDISITNKNGNEVSIDAVAAEDELDFVKAKIVVDDVELSSRVHFDVEKALPKQNVQLVLSDLGQTYEFEDEGHTKHSLVIPVGLKDSYIDKIIGDGDGVVSATFDKNEDQLFSLVEAQVFNTNGSSRVEYKYDKDEKHYIDVRTNNENLDSLIGYRFLNQTTGAKFVLPTEEDLVVAEDYQDAWDNKNALIAFVGPAGKIYQPGEQVDITTTLSGTNEKASALYAVWAPRYELLGTGIYRGEAPATIDELIAALENNPSATYKNAEFQLSPALVKTVFDKDSSLESDTVGYKYELAEADSVTWTAYNTSGILTKKLTALDADKLKNGTISVIGEEGFTVYPSVKAGGLDYDLGKDEEGNDIGVAYTVDVKGPSYEINLDALPDEMEGGQEISEIGSSTPITVGIKQFIDNIEQAPTSAQLAASGDLKWTSTSDLISVEMDSTPAYADELTLTAAVVSADSDVELKVVYTDKDGFTQEATKTIKVKKPAVTLKFYTNETAAVETTSFEASAVVGGTGDIYVKAVSDTATSGTWSLVVANPEDYTNAGTTAPKATIKFGDDVAGTFPSSNFKSVGTEGVRKVTVSPEAYDFDGDNEVNDDVLLGDTVLLAKYTVGNVTYTAPITMTTYLPIAIETQNGSNSSINVAAINEAMAAVTSKEVAVKYNDTDISIINPVTKAVTAEIRVYADDIDAKTQKVAKDLDSYKVIYSGDHPVKFKGWVTAKANPETINRYVDEAKTGMKIYASYATEDITSISPKNRLIKLDNTTIATGATELPIVTIQATVEPGDVDTSVVIAPEAGDFFLLGNNAVAPVSGTDVLPNPASIQGISMKQIVDADKNLRTDVAYVQALPNRAGKTELHLIAMDDTAVESTITLSVSGFDVDPEGRETYWDADGNQAKGVMITVDGEDHYYDKNTGYRVMDGKCELNEGTVLLKGNIKQTGLIAITEDNGDVTTYWVDPATGMVKGGVIADQKDTAGNLIARYVIDQDGKLIKPTIASGDTYAIITAVDGKTYLADKDGKILTNAAFQALGVESIVAGGEEYVVGSDDTATQAKAYYYTSHAFTWSWNSDTKKPKVKVTVIYTADDGTTRSDENVVVTDLTGGEIVNDRQTWTAKYTARYGEKGSTEAKVLEESKNYNVTDGSTKVYTLSGKVGFSNWTYNAETKVVTVDVTATYDVTENGQPATPATETDTRTLSTENGTVVKSSETEDGKYAYYEAIYTGLDGVQYPSAEKKFNVETGKTGGDYNFEDNAEEDGSFTAAFKDDVTEYVYTGAAQKPEIIVTNGEKTLVAGVDYTVSYKNNTNVGKAQVIVTGKGNYSSKDILYFDITKADIADAAIGNLAYKTNTADDKIKPTANYMGKNLKFGTDYTVTLGDMDSATNTRTATIKGAGNNFDSESSQEVTISYLASPAKINATFSFPKTGFTYTGEPVLDAATILEKYVTVTNKISDDANVYVTLAKEPKNVGTYKVAVTSDGLTGVKTGSFKIVPAKTATMTITNKTELNDTGVAFKVLGATPYVAVSAKIDDSHEYNLTLGKDYKVTYANNKAAGTGKYTVTFLGNYKGAQAIKNETFKINKANLSDAEVTIAGDFVRGANDKSNQYLAKADKKLFVSVGGMQLKKSEYTVTYKQGETTLTGKGSETITFDESGEATITAVITPSAKAKSLEGDAITKDYTVKAAGSKKDVSKAKLTVVEKGGTKAAKVGYTGQEIKFDQEDENRQGDIIVKGKIGGVTTTLTAAQVAENFDVQYVNNITKGKATVILTAKDSSDYVGSIVGTFTIRAHVFTTGEIKAD